MKGKTLKRFRTAVYRLKHRKVRKMLRKHPMLAFVTMPGLPALHVAAARNSVRLLEALLDGGADIEAADSAGNRPLHRAAVFGADACVDALLASGCDPNAANDSGETALHGAALRGNAAVIPLLLAGGADPHLLTAAGDSPMALALRSGDEQAISALAQHAQALVPDSETEIEIDAEDSLAEWLDLFDADDEDEEEESGETELPARYRVEFALCDWCGTQVMVGDGVVTVNRHIERVMWNGDLEREEIQVDDSEGLLTLCVACGAKLNLPALRDFLGNSPAARESP